MYTMKFFRSELARLDESTRLVVLGLPCMKQYGWVTVGDLIDDLNAELNACNRRLDMIVEVFRAGLNSLDAVHERVRAAFVREFRLLSYVRDASAVAERAQALIRAKFFVLSWAQRAEQAKNQPNPEVVRWLEEREQAERERRDLRSKGWWG